MYDRVIPFFPDSSETTYLDVCHKVSIVDMLGLVTNVDVSQFRKGITRRIVGVIC